MRLLGQPTQIGERVDERVAKAFDNVSDYRVGLPALFAIERWEWVNREIGSDGGVKAWRGGV